jgi:hypothetical protein
VQTREAVVAMVSWQEELTRRRVESRQRIEDLHRRLAEVRSELKAGDE